MVLPAYHLARDVDVQFVQQEDSDSVGHSDHSPWGQTIHLLVNLGIQGSVSSVGLTLNHHISEVHERQKTAHDRGSSSDEKQPLRVQSPLESREVVELVYFLRQRIDLEVSLKVKNENGSTRKFSLGFSFCSYWCMDHKYANLDCLWFHRPTRKNIQSAMNKEYHVSKNL